MTIATLQFLRGHRRLLYFIGKLITVFAKLERRCSGFSGQIMANFDFTSGPTILRMICGFFFLPHAVGKFTARAASFGFLHKAGFRPAPAFGYAGMLIEVALATLLILGFFTQFVAWFACVYLCVCALAVFKVERKWLWHIGGCEFPVFWAICCAVVAMMFRG